MHALSLKDSRCILKRLALYPPPRALFYTYLATTIVDSNMRVYVPIFVNVQYALCGRTSTAIYQY